MELLERFLSWLSIVGGPIFLLFGFIYLVVATSKQSRMCGKISMAGLIGLLLGSLGLMLMG